MKEFITILFIPLMLFSCMKTEEKLVENNLKHNDPNPLYSNKAYVGQQCAPIAYNYMWDRCRNLAIEMIGLDKLYELRDNILSQSERGQNYIDYYYTLSGYCINNGLMDECADLAEHYMLFRYGVEVSINILNADFNGVLLNDEIYNEGNRLLSLYKNTNPNQEILNILNTLESDLNTLHNKSADEVRSFFN